jgi:hypothetical protein
MKLVNKKLNMNDEINWTDEPPFHYNRCRVHAKSEAIMVTADTYF